MRFMLTFAWKPDAGTCDEGIVRFKATRGAGPPRTKLLGRWTRADLSGGFVLLESDDPKSLTAFWYNWGDLMELSIVPVVNDEELSDDDFFMGAATLTLVRRTHHARALTPEERIGYDR